jgi:hypothetical protein
MFFKLVSDVLRRRQAHGAAQIVVQARAACEAQDFQAAAELLEAARGNGNADLDALHLLGFAYKRIGREDEAAKAITEALRLEFGIAVGDDAATAAALAGLLWREPVRRWRHRLESIERLGRHFSRNGGYASWGEKLLAELAQRDPAQLDPESGQNAVFATLRLLDFDTKATAQWVELVFGRLVLPWMRRAAAADRYGVALMLETHAYAYYVAREESEERFRRSFALWAEDLRRAGARAARTLKPLPRLAREAVPAVGFYLQSGSILAHTRLLLEFLEAHAAFERPMIRPWVFLRGPADPQLASRLRAIGVPCHDLEAQSRGGQGTYFQSLVLMRSRIAAERIAAVVWVSVAPQMAFGFAMQVAPVQVWWALKYHSLDFPEIDGYLTSGSAGSTKRLGARVWRSSPLGARDWYRPELAGEARATRSRFAQHRLLFGSFGREAKLNSADFLGAVARILHAVPEAGFLWTGRDRNPEIQSRLEAHGVAARCHYIGWVDTKLYAQVIDVFLDSFPFPCAYTLYESMAAARPCVQFASAEAEESGLHSMLAPLLAGEEGTPEEQERARAIFGRGPGSLYLCAADSGQYVEHAVRLAADAALRRAAGEANRRFVAEFLSDPAHVARTLATHLVEIIGEKSNQGAR